MNIEIKTNTKLALLSVFMETRAIHFGLKRDPYVVLKRKGDKEVEVECDWVWGRATEQYDHSLEYFGLGPLMLLVW